MPGKRLYAFSERDWPDVRKMLHEFRAIGRTLRHPQRPVEQRRGGGSRTRLGKTNAAISKGSSGSISWYSDSSTDTGKDFNAENLFADLGSGKWVLAVKIGSGWVLSAGECS